MDWNFKYLVTLLLASVTNAAIVLNVSHNSAVNFNLPPFDLCGQYSLLDKYGWILHVGRTTTMIAEAFRDRGMFTKMSNGTLAFTLHRVTSSDEGRYSLRRDDNLMQTTGCDVSYQLNVLPTRDDGQWGSWTVCSAGWCGEGTRSRIHLDRVDTEACQSQYSCDWSSWTAWSVCGGGVACYRTRTRQCISEPSPHQAIHAVDSWKCGTEQVGTAKGGTGKYGTYRTEQDGTAGEDTGVERTGETQTEADGQQNEICHPSRCMTNYGMVDSHWGKWTSWSSCSLSCGQGTRTRVRHCLDSRNNIAATGLCDGDSEESNTCQLTSCGAAETKADIVADASQEPKLPWFYIVGGAGGAILVLVIVIIVLLVKLRRKTRKGIVGKQTQSSSSNRDGKHDVKHRAKKSNRKAAVSVESTNAAHVYDEINDADVNCYLNDTGAVPMARLSVVTIDNTYIPLPNSASTSPIGGQYVDQTAFDFGSCKNDKNNKNNRTRLRSDESCRESVRFTEIAEEEDEGVIAETSNSDWSSCVSHDPKRVSVDTFGYMMPGTREERERARRNRRFKKGK